MRKREVELKTGRQREKQREHAVSEGARGRERKEGGAHRARERSA